MRFYNPFRQLHFLQLQHYGMTRTAKEQEAVPLLSEDKGQNTPESIQDRKHVPAPQVGSDPGWRPGPFVILFLNKMVGKQRERTDIHLHACRKKALVALFNGTTQIQRYITAAVSTFVFTLSCCLCKQNMGNHGCSPSLSRDKGVGSLLLPRTFT